MGAKQHGSCTHTLAHFFCLCLSLSCLCPVFVFVFCFILFCFYLVLSCLILLPCSYFIAWSCIALHWLSLSCLVLSFVFFLSLISFTIRFLRASIRFCNRQLDQRGGVHQQIFRKTCRRSIALAFCLWFWISFTKWALAPREKRHWRLSLCCSYKLKANRTRGKDKRRGGWLVFELEKD